MNILYEDNHLLAVDKPAGMLVQGDQTGDKPLVDLGKEYIKKSTISPATCSWAWCTGSTDR